MIRSLPFFATILAIELVSAAALAAPLSQARLYAGEGCLNQGCSGGTSRWAIFNNEGGSGTGSLELSSDGTLTFSLTVAGASFFPTAPWGYDAGGVTQLDFSDLTYTGTAFMLYDGFGGVDRWSVSYGTGTISGFVTPIGAGSAGPFVGTTANGTNPLLDGGCQDWGSGALTCTIVIGEYTGFGVAVNGEERWFWHALEMTIPVPEPTPGLMVGLGLAVLARARERRRA